MSTLYKFRQDNEDRDWFCLTCWAWFNPPAGSATDKPVCPFCGSREVQNRETFIRTHGLVEADDAS